MFLNLSNHPSPSWSQAQLSAVGEAVTDLPFPQIDPAGDEKYIDSLVNQYFQKIVEIKDVSAVHIMGEMTFTFALVEKLKAKGIRCVASTTQRLTEEKNGIKTSVFQFVRFREYL